MPVPVSRMWTVASDVVGQRLPGRRRYPMVRGSGVSPDGILELSRRGRKKVAA